MTWLKDNVVGVLVAVAVLMAVGTVTGWVRAAEYRGEARIHEANADSAEARADALAAANERRAHADSIRWQATLDSMAARAARAEQARQREAAARERADSARARATRAAEDLRQTLTPEQVPLFESYETERDAEIAEKDVQIRSQAQRITELEAENVALFRSRESIAEIADGLRSELDEVRGANASLRASLDAMERAESAGGLLPDLGSFTRPVYVALGAALGYGLGRVGG